MICHHGGRSMQVALFLERNGFSAVLICGVESRPGPRSRSHHASLLRDHAARSWVPLVLAATSVGRRTSSRSIAKRWRVRPAFAALRPPPKPARKNLPQGGPAFCPACHFRQHRLERQRTQGRDEGRPNTATNTYTVTPQPAAVPASGRTGCSSTASPKLQVALSEPGSSRPPDLITAGGPNLFTTSSSPKRSAGSGNQDGHRPQANRRKRLRSAPRPVPIPIEAQAHTTTAVAQEIAAAKTISSQAARSRRSSAGSRGPWPVQRPTPPRAPSPPDEQVGRAAERT